jgi:predicted lipid-binding transport protein (Tim44 family)
LSLDQNFDPTLLVFAALAVLVLWKLRSVLGERSDRDISGAGRYQPQGAPFRSRTAQSAPPPASAARNQADDRWDGLAEKGSKSWAGLDAIAAADPNFSGPAFIEGARKAYEMIVMAFAKGDRETLRRLLSAEVFDNFAGEISAREARGETVESELVSIDAATVEDARAQAQSNVVTVRFASRLITARKNREGEIIEGALDHPAAIVDLWTFSRNPKAQDPNWRLVATESAH